MKATRILVVEDDAAIRQGLVDALASEGYAPESAADGVEAIRMFSPERFGLVLLDIMMPGRNGYDVCRAIRKTSDTTPILMLTAKSEEIDKVVGFELGADDYLTKPFGIRELLARVAALLRRARGAPAGNACPAEARPGVFRFADADVREKEFTAILGRKQHRLSAREMTLIRMFRANPNEVLSRDLLLDAAWGIHYAGTTRTLDQHMAQLRKKVEKNPANPAWLKTAHGIGYRYAPPPDDHGSRRKGP
ncbi:MAG: response regulator transcription factor [Lentisphaerae bacterium]|nr:response regulator transcription factor [Lentisphaerota bacterium]